MPPVVCINFILGVSRLFLVKDIEICFVFDSNAVVIRRQDERCREMCVQVVDFSTKCERSTRDLHMSPISVPELFDLLDFVVSRKVDNIGNIVLDSVLIFKSIDLLCVIEDVQGLFALAFIVVVLNVLTVVFKGSD
jgi:hypothetical protein